MQDNRKDGHALGAQGRTDMKYLVYEQDGKFPDVRDICIVHGDLRDLGTERVMLTQIWGGRIKNDSVEAQVYLGASTNDPVHPRRFIAIEVKDTTIVFENGRAIELEEREDGSCLLDGKTINCGDTYRLDDGTYILELTPNGWIARPWRMKADGW